MKTWFLGTLYNGLDKVIALIKILIILCIVLIVVLAHVAFGHFFIELMIFGSTVYLDPISLGSVRWAGYICLVLGGLGSLQLGLVVSQNVLDRFLDSTEYFTPTLKSK